MKINLPLMSNGLYRLTNLNKEEIARDILSEYSPKSLESAEPFDIDWFIEECLYLSLKSEHLTLNNSVLGMIAFGDTEVECYDERYRPKRLKLREGEIVTEKCLGDADSIRRLRFTKAHESSHWMLHRTYYSPDRQEYAFRKDANYIACRNIERFSSNNRTEEDWMEWQADSLGAALLMPKDIFIEVAQYEIFRHGIRRECLVEGDNRNTMYDIVTAVSDVYEVSKQATKIRFKQLGLFKTEEEYYSYY